MSHCPRGARRAALAITLLALAAAAPAQPVAGADGSSEPAASAPVDAAELERLVATIEDPDRRAELVAQLRALIEARRPGGAGEAGAGEGGGAEPGVGARVLGALSERLGDASTRLVAAGRALGDVPALLRELVRDRDGQPWRAYWGELLLGIALVIVVAVVAEHLARRALRGPAAKLEGRDGTRMWLRLPLLLGTALIEAIGLAVFAVAALAVLSFLEPRETTRLLALAIVNASVIARALLVVARAALAPRVPALRIPPLDDETANYWYLWARRLANVGVYGYFAAEAAQLLGLPAALHAMLLDALAIVLAVMLVVLVRQNRIPVANAIRGPSDLGGGIGVLRRRLGDLWHVVAIVYIAGVLAVWLLGIEGGFQYVSRSSVLSLAVIGVAYLAATILRASLVRALRLSDELKAEYPGLEARANRYLAMVRGTVGVAIVVVAALAVLECWDLAAFAWLASEGGQGLAGGALTIALIIAGALAIWEVVSSLIERYIHRESESSEAPSARVLTLLPLARKAIFVVLVVMVSLTVLSELGIDIGPLLAGAGVVGLAIGFGAQTLVKDIITGVFILLEDTISVGDVIELGGRAGVVESISIRTLLLRDLSGNVLTVPFSEVGSVLNYTKEYSYALLDIGVAYREDIEEVMRVLEQVGAELQENEKVGPNILAPIEILGLNEFADSAVVVRARLKTRPGTQWATRRAAFLHIKKRFDELGIEIPFPHQTIYFGEDKAGDAPSARVRVRRDEGVADGEPATTRRAGSRRSATTTENQEGRNQEGQIS